MKIARGVASGIESQGHTVDIIDGERDVNSKLTIYQYVAFGTASTTLFGGKISDKVGEFLSKSGMVAGKKSFAFVAKTPISASKALARLMRKMEHEGMFLRYSEVLRSPDEAEVVGSRLKIES
jgi:menaquinone-dependent protoporphyrinogen IX oxidase